MKAIFDGFVSGVPCGKPRLHATGRGKHALMLPGIETAQ